MQDRVPVYPGRVTLTPVAGQANTYDMVRADQPTQEGTPLNKDSLLKDRTVSFFGLDDTAVPDDVLYLLGNYIPTKYGLLVVRCTDAAGNPAGATVHVSPAVDGSNSVVIGDRGYFSALVTPGIYTITAGSATIFEKVTVNTPSVTVKSGEPVIASVTAERAEHGEVDITVDTTVVVPSWLTSIDLFGVGGGASGRASIDGNISPGGGGGYTTTILKQNLAGKILNINIGAGGVSSVARYGNSAARANPGGTTTITTSDGTKILEAGGGTGGTSALASNGGSGGGGAPEENGAGGVDPSFGGSDGSDGTGSGKGTGQGYTTRKFKEANGTLYASGGAGARVYGGDPKVGSPGSGGGNAYAKYYQSGNPPPNGIILRATDANTYGSGGGGITIKLYNSNWEYDYDPEAHSGAGKQGLVSIRW